MSEWLVSVPTESDAAEKRALEAERESAVRRVAAVRTHVAALSAAHAADAAARVGLLQACDQALPAAEDAASSATMLSRVSALEDRLDALRTGIVERAFQETVARASQEVRSATAAAKKAKAQRITQAKDAIARTEIKAAAQSAKEKLRRAAAEAEAAAAVAERRHQERAQRAVRAACAQLAAVVPALPGASKARVADDVRAIAAEAGVDPESASRRLAPLQKRIAHLISTERSTRRRITELASRCTSRLDEIQAASQEPAVSAMAWELRGRVAEALSAATPDERALLGVARELDSLADHCAQGVALDEQAAVTETLMAALQRGGYEVGLITEGSTFIAGGAGGLGIQFDVSEGKDHEVKAAIVRLAETPAASPEAGCTLIDDALEQISQDGAMPFRLRERARHLPRPLAELPFIDAAAVDWRAVERLRLAQDTQQVRHMDLDSEAT